MTKRKNESHKMSNTSTYKSWSGMKQRCTNPMNTSYYRYRARGISVCPEWLDSFNQFIKDMGPRPEGTSIDRIDNDGNYEPGNCRWATPIVQQRNKSTKKNCPFRVIGVSRATHSDMWRAEIKKDNKITYLGLFENFPDACLARANAEREIGGYPGDLDFRIKNLVNPSEPIVYTPSDDDPILEPITTEELRMLRDLSETVN